MNQKILIGILCGLLFSFLAVPAYASGEAGRAEVSFSKGLLAYNQKQHGPAAQHFKRAFELNPKNETAAYFAGLSYFHQGQFQPALTYFLKSIAVNGHNPEPRLYAGISHFRLRQNEQAKLQFKAAYDQAADGAIKDMALSYLRQLGAAGHKASKKSSRPAAEGESKPWFVFGSLTTQFDSNVSLDPANLTVTTLPSDQNDIGWFAQLGGGYYLVNRPKYRLTAKAVYSQSVYAELHAFNYGLAHAEIKPEFRSGKFFIEAPVFYDFSILATEKYMHSGGVGPQIGYMWNKRFMTTVSPKLRYDDFFQGTIAAPQKRDSLNFQAGLTQYFFFSDAQTSFVTAGYNLEHNFETGSDWKYLAHSVSSTFLMPLAWQVQLFASANITVDKTYANVDSVIGSRRDDWGMSYLASLSRPVIGPLTVAASYSFFRNQSNQNFFEYNKHVAGVTLSAAY